jgi:hypothetical protein
MLAECNLWFYIFVIFASTVMCTVPLAITKGDNGGLFCRIEHFYWSVIGVTIFVWYCHFKIRPLLNTTRRLRSYVSVVIRLLAECWARNFIHSCILNRFPIFMFMF